MNVPETLLARVLEAPDDDAPRLVVADWLMEHGDSQGELIALQCRSDRDRHWKRIAELERRLIASLSESLGLQPFELAVARGFVEGITGKSRPLGARLADVSQFTPLRHVAITDAPSGAMPALLARCGIRSLELHNLANPYFSLAFERSQLLESITSLCLHSGAHSSWRPAAFLRSPMPSLRELELSVGGDDDIIELKAPIRTLKLGFPIRRASLEAFAGTLRHLAVAGWDLAALTELTPPWLESLELRSIAPCDASTLARWEATEVPVTMIRTAGALSPATFGAFLRSRSLQTVQVLDLSLSSLGADAARQLIETELPCLHTLIVRGPQYGTVTADLDVFGPRAIETLAGSPLAGQLEVLDLEQSRIGDEGAVVLAGGFPALRALRLRGTDVGEIGVTALTRKGALPSLRELQLDDALKRDPT